jgi:disulfide bond formation protein DsbB
MSLNSLAWSNRIAFLVASLLCAALLGYAKYAEVVQGYEPCMLCMVQRYLVGAVGVSALLAALHGPKDWGWKVYGGLTAFWSALGVYIAGRHVYLQGLPPEELDGCAPSLEYALEYFGPLKVLKNIFIRDQDCGVIDWTFLGLSMPNWVLFFFVGFFCAALYYGFRRVR